MRTKRFLAPLLLSLPLAAQTSSDDYDVRNAASFLSPSAPGGAIAQGSIFTASIAGDLNLQFKQSSFPLTERPEGVRIEITTADGELFLALPLSVNGSSVRAILPSTVPVGEHQLQAFYTNSPSPPARIKVVRTSPGIFTTWMLGHKGLAGRDISTPAAPGEQGCGDDEKEQTDGHPRKQ